MAFVQNLPFISIILSLFTGPLSSVLGGKKAKYLNAVMITVVGLMSFAVLGYVVGTGESYTYMMGHFPAPWGNEIRVGVLEALMACAFSVFMLLCVVGGVKEREIELEESKQNLYYILSYTEIIPCIQHSLSLHRPVLLLPESLPPLRRPVLLEPYSDSELLILDDCYVRGHNTPAEN